MKAHLRNYLASILWLTSTIATVSRRQLGAFVSATVLMGFLRVAQFLVSVLPLKVLLLASHEGVPSYTPFISPETKPSWILGLALATIVAYILVQFLDSFTTRICDRASTLLVSEAATLSIVPNQQEKARGIFSDLASIVADAAFWVAGMVLYLVIAPTTFAVYFALASISLLLGLAVAGSEGRWHLRGVHLLLSEKTNTYLNANSAVIFFVCFLVILFPYLVGTPENMLIGLISIMLLRRTLSAAFDATKGALKSIRNRPLVDALMFRDRQLVQQGSPEQSKFMKQFGVSQRNSLVIDMLASAAIETPPEQVSWSDSPIPGISIFDVACSDGTHYQLQVFQPNKTSHLVNEGVLFTMVERIAIGAPECIAQREYEGYSCQLLTAGEGRQLSHKDWLQMRTPALLRTACVIPPEGLVDAYRSNHRLAFERLTPELVKKARFAARDHRERQTLKLFLNSLEEVRSCVGKLPLAISSPHFGPAYTMRNGGAFPLLMFWGQWSLVPIGAGAAAVLPSEDVQAFLTQARRSRTDIDEAVTPEDLILAAKTDKLVSQLERGSLRAALDTIGSMLGLSGGTRVDNGHDPSTEETNEGREDSPSVVESAL